VNFRELTRIAREETDALLREFPPLIRKAVSETEIFYEPAPSRADRMSGIDPDLLGYFDPGPESAPAPRIRLWLENLWDFSESDEETFREEVRITLLHEIGHLLGWDEDEVADRGLG